MLLITQSTSGNVIITTCNERITLTSPYFLIRFICDSDKTETSCICSDISSYAYRYNKFLIEEKTSPTRTAGQVRLATTGRWTYEIYEQSSSTNLDYTLATVTTPVEVGILKVIGTSTSTSTYTSASNEKVIYNG